MSFVHLQEAITPGVTAGLDTDDEVLHKLHNARGAVYFTADTAWNESAPGAADGGAVGNGMADDRLPIQAAIDACAAAGGGVVVLTGKSGKTFRVTQAPTKAWAINLATNVVVTGQGRGTSTVKLANSQVNFCRVFTGTSVSNCVIRDMTVDGNTANQAPVGDTFQQHSVFLNACTDAVIDNVEVMNAHGDGIYWFGNCVRPAVLNCRIHANVRTGIHAQRYTQGQIRGCYFYAMTADNMIKSEQDAGEPNPVASELIIDGNTFDGGGNPVNGVLLSGLDATHKLRNTTVTHNTFQNFSDPATVAVSMGQDSDGWIISSNNFDNCAYAIRAVSYNVAFGYTGTLGVSIIGNLIREATATDTKAQILVANATGVEIIGNRVEGTGIIAGIEWDQCDSVELASNRVAMASGGLAYTSYRSTNVTFSGSAKAPGGTGYLITGNDGVTYLGTNHVVGYLSVSGTPAKGLDVAGHTATGQLTLGLIVAPGATSNIVFGLDQTKLSTEFRIRAPIIATASLPSAGSTRDGTLIIEDNGAGDRNLIVYAGGQRFRIDGGAAF